MNSTLSVVPEFQRDPDHAKAYNRWKQKCKQRAKQRLLEAHRDEYEKYELEERLVLWHERPRSKNMRDV